MSKARKLVYEFDRKFDRFSGEKKKNISLVDKMSVLNEAQLIFFEAKSKLVEITTEYRKTLSQFEVRDRKLKLKSKDDGVNVYETPGNYYKALAREGEFSKDGCGTKRFPLTNIRSDKLKAALKNPYWKPSYYWESAFIDEDSEGFVVYYDPSSEVVNVYLTYLRYPKEIHAPSLSANGMYEDWNGIIRRRDVDCEFDDNDSRKIVDIAVLLARAEMGDVRDFQVELNKLMIDVDRSPKI